MYLRKVSSDLQLDPPSSPWRCKKLSETQGTNYVTWYFLNTLWKELSLRGGIIVCKINNLQQIFSFWMCYHKTIVFPPAFLKSFFLYQLFRYIFDHLMNYCFSDTYWKLNFVPRKLSVELIFFITNNS